MTAEPEVSVHGRKVRHRVTQTHTHTQKQVRSHAEGWDTDSREEWGAHLHLKGTHSHSTDPSSDPHTEQTQALGHSPRDHRLPGHRDRGLQDRHTHTHTRQGLGEDAGVDLTPGGTEIHTLTDTPGPPGRPQTRTGRVRDTQRSRRSKDAQGAGMPGNGALDSPRPWHRGAPALGSPGTTPPLVEPLPGRRRPRPPPGPRPRAALTRSGRGRAFVVRAAHKGAGGRLRASALRPPRAPMAGPAQPRAPARPNAATEPMAPPGARRLGAAWPSHRARHRPAARPRPLKSPLNPWWPPPPRPCLRGRPRRTGRGSGEPPTPCGRTASALPLTLLRST